MTEETTVDTNDLLKKIQEQFYTGADPKRFWQDRNLLLLALTWPASWLRERGIAWSARQYRDFIQERLQDVKRHGATAQIRHFPTYLLKVVQDHLAHNGHSYCDDAKKTGWAFDMALGRAIDGSRLQAIQAAEKSTEILAEAHRLLAIRRRPAKPQKPAPAADSQSLLFDV